MGIQIADIYASAHFKDEGLLAGLEKVDAKLDDVGDGTKEFAGEEKNLQRESTVLGRELNGLSSDIDDVAYSTEGGAAGFLGLSNSALAAIGVIAGGAIVIGAAGYAIGKSVNYTAEWSEELQKLDKSAVESGMSMNAFTMQLSSNYSKASGELSRFGNVVKLNLGERFIKVATRWKELGADIVRPIYEQRDALNASVDSALAASDSYDEFMNTLVKAYPTYDTFVKMHGDNADAIVRNILVQKGYTEAVWEQVHSQMASQEAMRSSLALLKEFTTIGGGVRGPNIPGLIGGQGGFNILENTTDLIGTLGENWKLFEAYGSRPSQLLQNLQILQNLDPQRAAQLGQEALPIYANMNVELGIMSESQAINNLTEQMGGNAEAAKNAYLQVKNAGGAYKALDGLVARSVWIVDVYFNYHGGGGIPSSGQPVRWGQGVPEDIFASGASGYIVPRSFAPGGNFVVPRGFSGMSSGYPIMVHSGERVNVDTASKTQVDNDALLSELQGMRSELATLKTSIRDAVLMAV